MDSYGYKELFLSLLYDELRELYYQPNESSRYRFFVYLIEQIHHSYEMRKLFFIGKDREAISHQEKMILAFLETADTLISIPDIFSISGIKKIKKESKQIEKVLGESYEKIFTESQKEKSEEHKNEKKERESGETEE